MAWKTSNSLQTSKTGRALKRNSSFFDEKIITKKFHIENIALEKDRLIIETKDSVLAQELNFEKKFLKRN